jgi:hypothetical protein
MIVIDDFLPEGKFKADLCNADRWQKSLPYSWYSSGDKTKNIWEDFAHYIWTEVFKTAEDIKPDGFEYWTNNVPQNGMNDLPWHYDKDEHLFDTTRKVLTPHRGIVYYCHSELPDGGYLEIKREGDVERLQPVPNRLIIFDPSISHRVTEVKSGNRWTFASNLWIDKPMSENFV